jgi:serine/threonine protein kinase, bacterial
MSLATGQMFAGYAIVRRLGSGAMGEVYLAEHPRLPRRDALKVLAQQVSNVSTYRERFNREAQNASTLSHPHIVAVYDRGEYEGQLWISMGYVEGTDAARLLKEQYRKGMPPDAVVRIVATVADALDYAHQRQLLHRDVKPANILLAELDSGGWRALLADFGLARRVDDSSGLTQTNMAVGTIAYAAPEQLMGLTLDGRTDQYSLAATAFELLTGSYVYLDPNPAVVISQHVSAPPPAIADRKPELSNLGPVLSKALAKSPRDRYDTCMDFAKALARQADVAVGDLGIDDAAIAPARRRGNEPKSRKRPPAIASAILMALLIAGAVRRSSSPGVTKTMPSTSNRRCRPCQWCSLVRTAKCWGQPESPRPDRRRTAHVCRPPGTSCGPWCRAWFRRRPSLQAPTIPSTRLVLNSRSASASRKPDRHAPSAVKTSGGAIFTGRHKRTVSAVAD